MIILHQLLQLGGARPIQAVQLQRAAVGVVVAMLGAGKLFAPLHERQTLAGQVNTRRHAVLGQQIGIRRGIIPAAGHAFQLIPQGIVIMGRNILHHLTRRLGHKIRLAAAPRRDRMQHLIPTLHIAVDVACAARIEHPALDGIAGVIAEKSNAAVQQARRLFVGGDRAVFHAGAAALPRFTVHEDIFATGQGIQRSADCVHGVHIVQSHQVKAEPVNMVLFGPVHTGIHQILAHHRALAGKVTPAAGAVGQASVFPPAVPVAGHRAFQPAVGIIGMIIHHIHHHAQPGAVQGLHHGAAFPHAHLAVERIGGIAALRQVIIQRVIPPVVVLAAHFVHRGKVKNRLQLHMGHTQPLEVVQPGGVYAVPVQGGAVHRKTHKLAAVSLRHAAGRVGGKIRHMHLPHAAGMGGDGRAFILLPAVRHGGGLVQHHAAGAPCPGCVGVGVRCNGGGSIRELQLILVILPGQVTRQFQVPGAALTALHGQGAKVGSFRLCVRARSKAVQCRAARRGGPQAECRSAAAPHCTKVIPGINRQLRCLCFVHGDSSY